MRTKEEILDKQVENGTTGGTKDAMKRYGRFDCRIIHAAMEDYAKQQSVAFNQYITGKLQVDKSTWVGQENDKYIMLVSANPDKQYSKFIEHQQSTDNKKQ